MYVCLVATPPRDDEVYVAYGDTPGAARRNVLEELRRLYHDLEWDDVDIEGVIFRELEFKKTVPILVTHKQIATHGKKLLGKPQ